MLTLLFKIVEGTVLRSTEFSTNGNATIYGWKYRHYFGNKTQSCKLNFSTLCPAHCDKNPLSTAHNATSNLKKHLETVHKPTSLTEKDHDGDESRKRRRDLVLKMLVSQASKSILVCNTGLCPCI